VIAGGCFVTIRRVGVTVLAGAIGGIENVGQLFHPDESVFHPKSSIR